MGCKYFLHTKHIILHITIIFFEFRKFNFYKFLNHKPLLNQLKKLIINLEFLKHIAISHDDNNDEDEGSKVCFK